MNLQHFNTTNLAILLKQAPVPTLESGLIGQVKSYFVLALVSPDTKSGGLGKGMVSCMHRGA